MKYVLLSTNRCSIFAQSKIDYMNAREVRKAEKYLLYFIGYQHNAHQSSSLKVKIFNSQLNSNWNAITT